MKEDTSVEASRRKLSADCKHPPSVLFFLAATSLHLRDECKKCRSARRRDAEAFPRARKNFERPPLEMELAPDRRSVHSAIHFAFQTSCPRTTKRAKFSTPGRLGAQRERTDESYDRPSDDPRVIFRGPINFRERIDLPDDDLSRR